VEASQLTSANYHSRLRKSKVEQKLEIGRDKIVSKKAEGFIQARDGEKSDNLAIPQAFAALVVPGMTRILAMRELACQVPIDLLEPSVSLSDLDVLMMAKVFAAFGNRAKRRL
jgi:hypothetical protein